MVGHDWPGREDQYEIDGASRSVKIGPRADKTSYLVNVSENNGGHSGY